MQFEIGDPFFAMSDGTMEEITFNSGHCDYSATMISKALTTGE